MTYYVSNGMLNLTKPKPMRMWEVMRCHMLQGEISTYSLLDCMCIFVCVKLLVLF